MNILFDFFKNDKGILILIPIIGVLYTDFISYIAEPLYKSLDTPIFTIKISTLIIIIFMFLKLNEFREFYFKQKDIEKIKQYTTEPFHISEDKITLTWNYDFISNEIYIKNISLVCNCGNNLSIITSNDTDDVWFACQDYDCNYTYCTDTEYQGLIIETIRYLLISNILKKQQNNIKITITIDKDSFNIPSSTYSDEIPYDDILY